jgi:hypothetical protein
MINQSREGRKNVSIALARAGVFLKTFHPALKRWAIFISGFTGTDQGNRHPCNVASLSAGHYGQIR